MCLGNVTIWFQNGDTALHIAAALKRRKIAKILVESHVDVHVKNKVKITFYNAPSQKQPPYFLTKPIFIRNGCYWNSFPVYMPTVGQDT